MFAMAHGQGIILVAVGVGAGFLLPKAGPWMDRVKYVFGVMLIGVAIYLLGTLPQIPVLILWSVLLIVTAVFLGATQSLRKRRAAGNTCGKVSAPSCCCGACWHCSAGSWASATS